MAEGAALREFVQQREEGQDQGGERGFEQEGDGEVVPPAVGAVLTQQVGLMAAAAVAQQAQDGNRVGGGGHGEGDARRRYFADLEAVDGPEGRAGDGKDEQATVEESRARRARRGAPEMPERGQAERWP